MVIYEVLTAQRQQAALYIDGIGQAIPRGGFFQLFRREEEMRKDGCSQQDLRLFLADNNNNVYFLKVLDETKRHSRKDKIIELSKQFCEELKKRLREY